MLKFEYNLEGFIVMQKSFVGFIFLAVFAISPMFGGSVLHDVLHLQETAHHHLDDHASDPDSQEHQSQHHEQELSGFSLPLSSLSQNLAKLVQFTEVFLIRFANIEAKNPSAVPKDGFWTGPPQPLLSLGFLSSHINKAPPAF
jgi:hypothetical protein